MKSYDPWRVMQSSPPAEMMVVPAPYYGHPFIDECAGIFIGAEASTQPPERRSDLTAVLAPVLAPARSGFSAKMKLDDRQCLHAAICVDGKCYKTSIDLAPAIAAVMQKFAQYHASLHDGSAPSPHLAKISGDVMIGAVDQAVAAAGDALIGALLDQHVGTACAGWLDDIGDAVKGAGVGIYRGVTETVQKLKTPITAVAVAAATVYGGPAGGAAAAKFVGPIIDSAANLGKDTPAKAAAEQAAKTDPAVATALSAAKEAVAHTVAAFHVTETAKQAAAGHPAAQQQIAQVTRDAEKGDPVAHAMAPLVAHGFSTAIATRRQAAPAYAPAPAPAPAPAYAPAPAPAPGAGPESYRQTASHAVAHAHQRYQQQSGGKSALAVGYTRLGRHQKVYLFHAPEEAQSWYGALPSGQYSYVALFDVRDLATPLAENFGGGATAVSGYDEIVGAAIDFFRTHAVSLASSNARNVVGVIHTSDGLWHALSFGNSDDADDWLGQATRNPASYTYAAYFDKGDFSWPHPLNEKIGQARTPTSPGVPIPREFATT